MVATDARKEAMKQAEVTLKADTAANEKEKDHARAQTAEDEKQLAELNAARKELRSGVAEESLNHYDRVLKLRGSATAPVHEDESCSACRVRLRPQVFQEVMSNEQIITCFYCNRILYYVPPPPQPEEAAAKNAKAGDAAKPPEEESAEADDAAAQ
jgi:predicted  nucleic acid-binding Zn-ribbon protein